jgi:hypothetical protein
MPLLALIFFFNILPYPRNAVSSDLVTQCAAVFSADTWIYGSALVSVIISLSAFSSQKLMTGTAFVTLNNVNKIPGIVISSLVFGALLNLPMITGLSLSLFSGFLFALFSDTTKHISNLTIFQTSLVIFIIANIIMYFDFTFAVLFKLNPIDLNSIGTYAPAAIKALPALLMSILVFCSTSNAKSFQRPPSYVALALVFSACGDFALELTGVPQSFMVGMAFFAVAQWFFITAFSLNDVPLRPMRAAAPYVLAFVALLAMKDGVIKEARADIGLGIGVVVYSMLLAGSAWRAIARIDFVPALHEFKPIMILKQRTVAAAAVIFMLSDLLIAWDKFSGSPTGLGGHALVMILYWLAQGLYTASMFHYETPYGFARAVRALFLAAIAAFVAVAYTAFVRVPADVSAVASNITPSQ